jgi:hypothetical protein
MIDRVFILLGLSLCLTAPSWAQSADQADQQETVKALLQEIKELKSRVAALEAKQTHEGAVVAAPQPTPTPSAIPPAEAQAPVAEPGAFGINRGIKFQGFGSVTYKATDAVPSELGAVNGFRPGTAGSFSIGVGDVALFLTSQLTAKSMVLTEITFSETVTGEFNSEVERLLFKYDANDSLKTSFGRFRTATSYYNKTFHHGLWLQTATDRPLVVEFSEHGGLIPSQATGGSVTGRIPSGKLGLNYIFEYGTPQTDRPQITTTDAGDIAFHNGNETTAGLFVQPDSIPGLEIGGSFYHDRISPAFSDVDSGLHFGESVVSAHVVYVTPHFEWLNEGFLIQHKEEETKQKFNTPAFYSLISNKFGRHWRPYFRYQYANASTGSPLFPDIGKRFGPSAGIRYDFNDYVALKTQFDRTYRDPLPVFNDIQVQLAFRF